MSAPGVRAALLIRLSNQGFSPSSYALLETFSGLGGLLTTCAPVCWRGACPHEPNVVPFLGEPLERPLLPQSSIVEPFNLPTGVTGNHFLQKAMFYVVSSADIEYYSALGHTL